MVTYFRWSLLIPILILVLGTSILLSNEVIIKDIHQSEARLLAAIHSTKQNTFRPTVKREASIGEDLKNNRQSAYPYFLLGAGLLVILLLLPKLTELSFSPTSGFTLKILQDTQKALAEVNTAAQVVATKAKQSVRVHSSETLLAPNQPDLQDEIRKLEESTTKLDTYARLLENMLEKKGK